MIKIKMCETVAINNCNNLAKTSDCLCVSVLISTLRCEIARINNIFFIQKHLIKIENYIEGR